MPAQTTGVSNPRRWSVLVLMVRIWGVSHPSHIGYRVSPALTCRLRSPPVLPSTKETISLGSESSVFPADAANGNGLVLPGNRLRTRARGLLIASKQLLAELAVA